MARRKQTSVYVPETLAEAEQMAGEYTDLERRMLLEDLACDEAIDAAKKQRSDTLAEMKAEAQPLFDGLKAWFEAGGDKLIAKGKKSGALGKAQIGHRTGMPKLKFKRGTSRAKFLDWLLGLRLAGKAEWLRIPKTQLDANAVIKTLREGGGTAISFESQGAFVEQAEEFFIDTGLDLETLKDEAAR